MFPGTDDEMTNLFCMDGDDLVLTHYCAAGNQPRLRASLIEPQRIAFAFDGVSDNQPHEGMMDALVLTFLANDRIEAAWQSRSSTGACHSMTMTLTRLAESPVR